MIHEEKLRALIASEEGQYHERKSLFEGPPGRKRVRDRRAVRDHIAEYVAGFANAEGGILILGVEDDGSVTGHAYPDEAVDQMLAVPTTRLVPPQPAGRRVAFGTHELLVFEVDMATTAVRVQDDGFPYRIGDTTQQWSEAHINRLKEHGLIESAEARRARATLDQLDGALVERAIQGAGLAGVSVPDYLVRRRLADRQADELILREAAVLLFASEPHVIAHPNAGVRVFRVAGREQLTGARRNVQEFPRLEGNLPAVLEEARALLGTLIQRSSRLHDLFFKELPEYPTFAWQEALVNAVAHRDYGVQGRGVEVYLYEDRLEVLSPGSVSADIELDDLRAGRPAHASRNPRLARVLAELGVMRDQGEGIPRMFDEMQTSFLPLPELDVVAGQFRVVLRNEPIFRTDDPAWSQAVRAMPLAVSQKRALVALVDRAFANSDYGQLNALDRDAAYRELSDLVARGLVRAVGTGAGTRYQIVRAPAAAAPPPSPLARLVARMDEVGFITNSDYREAFEVDRQDAKRALAAWVSAGVLAKEGEKRGTKYRPGSAWPPLP